MIDNSYLLGLFGSSSLLPTSSGTSGVVKKKTDPTPPWDPKAQAPALSDRLRAALAGRRLVDVSAAQLDVAGASEDYRKLFALYQGLDTLRGLAARMDVKGVASTEKGLIERRFAAGLDEVGGFVDALKLDKLRLVAGETAEKLKSGGVQRDQRDYLGAVIHQGASDASVAALQGDVRFNIDIKKETGGTIQVAIDLANMGSTPRTMAAVIEHVNGKLEAAGVQTRLARERIPGQPKTVTVGGKSVTLPAGPDQYALKIKGSTVETVGFSAPDTADAIYLAQRGGKADAGQQQLLKFQTDQVGAGAPPPPAVQRPGDTHWVDGRSFQTTLGAEVGAVRATAAATDGSVYVLADVTDATGGQAIKGDQDVALMKYDSAGKLVWSRTLGAADTASGFALAVSADGKVAVAGSVTGELDRGDDGLDAKLSDSFVSVYDTEGDELWTARRGARAADEASAVSFGADGSVYVAGRARSTMPGATGAMGGYDGYLQGFSAKGVATFSTQFGGAGDDRATAVAVDGGAVLVGGVENGRAVVRRFTLNPGAAPTLAATRDLGDLKGGALTGLAVDNGRVIVAGTTGNAALSAGTITRAHAGGSEAFVAALDPGLAAGAGDRLTYFGGTGDDGATAMAVSGGKVWLTGKAGTDLAGMPAVGTKDGYLARLDPNTGAIEWSRRFTGKDGETAPSAIAVGKGAASVLDRLGLPTAIDPSDSKRVVSATALRAGDQFMVRAGTSGRGVAVKIAATDTLADVARKIERASGFRAKVSVVKDGDVDRLEIKPRDTRAEIEVLAGEGGTGTLAALGLAEGLVRKPGEDDEDQDPIYGLKLPRELALDTPAAVKETLARLDAVLSTVRRAYRDLVAAGKPEVKPVTGQAPAYLQNQLANYQAALSRLGGG